jgi:hypothetical protein
MRYAALLIALTLSGCGPLINIESIDFRAENVRAIDMEQKPAEWRSACENDCMCCEWDRALGRTGDEQKLQRIYD